VVVIGAAVEDAADADAVGVRVVADARVAGTST
jgi:hypothetical protein